MREKQSPASSWCTRSASKHTVPVPAHCSLQIRTLLARTKWSLHQVFGYSFLSKGLSRQGEVAEL